MEKASLALGELSGVGRILPNPELLIRPFSRAEAVASSRIEGTVTSAPELLMLELSPDAPRVRADTREVNNYNRALQHGLKRINELPLSKRLLNELHGILLEGVSAERGARVVPGELRRDQNWIGSRTIQNARFVPPPPSAVLDALDGFERFIHRENETLPLLIKLALLHYQFETIHPYPDGNGRVGRLIIPLVLCEQKAMSQPLLYLSAYFEKHYTSYIDLMFEVSKSGAWEQWIEFFLNAVEVSSHMALKKAHLLQDLHRQYMAIIRSARSSALLAKVVDSLFELPAMTVPHAANELGISYNSAKNNVKKLVELQILTPDDSNQHPQWFFAWGIIQIANIPDA
ncbi:MAG: Fic family protein [Beijerinckiaceae bacterium]|nr:Fic family protein [Beijerinckiaceae bacterium]